VRDINTFSTIAGHLLRLWQLPGKAGIAMDFDKKAYFPVSVII